VRSFFAKVWRKLLLLRGKHRAQRAKPGPENPRVGGSIPSLATNPYKNQMVTRPLTLCRFDFLHPEKVREIPPEQRRLSDKSILVPPTKKKILAPWS